MAQVYPAYAQVASTIDLLSTAPQRTPLHVLERANTISGRKRCQQSTARHGSCELGDAIPQGSEPQTLTASRNPHQASSAARVEARTAPSRASVAASPATIPRSAPDAWTSRAAS